MSRIFLYSQIGLDKGLNKGEKVKMWTECGQMLDTTLLLFVSLPLKRSHRNKGAIAQLGERLRGTQEVSGSIPLSSTIFCLIDWLSGELLCNIFTFH